MLAVDRARRDLRRPKLRWQVDFLEGSLGDAKGVFRATLNAKKLAPFRIMIADPESDEPARGKRTSSQCSRTVVVRDE